jgi:hypothetical protein
LRNYAITLNAALAPAGIYAGIIEIGGIIDRSNVREPVSADPELMARLQTAKLNPDDLAETAWQLYTKQEDAEAVVMA